MAQTELDGLIDLAEIPETSREVLQANSMGLFTLPDFLTHYQTQGLQKAVALGVESDSLWAAVYGLDLTDWHTAYRQLGISSANPNHTEQFLTGLTESGQAAIFFVPPQLYTHPLIKYTRVELEWFVNNPQSCRDTSFVFGLYEAGVAQI